MNNLFIEEACSGSGVSASSSTTNTVNVFVDISRLKKLVYGGQTAKRTIQDVSK